MMLSDVHQGDLPGQGGRASILRDLSSFGAIAEAANAVLNVCGRRDHFPGWAIIGKLSTAPILNRID